MVEPLLNRMICFEYKRIKVENAEMGIVAMNAWGILGWELVGFVNPIHSPIDPGDFSYIYVFKRPLRYRTI